MWETAEIAGRRRDIAFAPAYMLLGQMVAISVALSLFLIALSIRPRNRPSQWAPPTLYVPLFASMATIYLVPSTVGTDRFLPNLLAMHALLVVPLLPISPARDSTNPARPMDISFTTLYALLITAALALHVPQTAHLLRRLPEEMSLSSYLYARIFSHPAQASISLDVVWVAITLTSWWLMTGSFITIAFKAVLLGLAAGVAIARYTGVDWSLVLSAFPILALLTVGVILLGISRIRKRNVKRRFALLEKMGISDNQVIPGTDKRPPSKSSVKTVVGFFHPYWYAVPPSVGQSKFS